MMLRETVRTALRSLVTNRLRTALTALGMVMGVAAVVTVLAIAEGARQSVETQIRSLGSNLMTVRPSRARIGAIRTGSVETLSRADAEAIAKVPGVRAVAAESRGTAQIRHLDNNLSGSVVGVTEDYFFIRSIEVARGLAFSAIDDEQRARVAVIGSNVTRELFGDDSAIGARIQVQGITLRVVGMLAEKGEGYLTPDDSVFVPLGTHQGVIFGQPYLTSIPLSIEDEERTDEIRERISQLLRLRHRLGPHAPDDFEVRSQTEMLQMMSAVTGTLAALLASVAAVSLLVGGIGIMNIMLVSVRERTREIGVRMAVGARRRDVLVQFLVEALVVSIAGGLIGLVLGYGAAYLVAELGEWETIVPAYSLALALGVSTFVGLVFGVGPARRAALLDPVEALRQE
jgi:putative ABC transport system permease protein